MHIVTRTLGVLAASAALTAAALPAHAVDEPVTIDQRLGEIALVDDAVPVRHSPLEPVRADGAVTLSGAGSAGVSLGLPVGKSSQVSKNDGRYVVPASDGASLAVAPTADGAQILIGIEEAGAPTNYDFELDAADGLTGRVTPDGAVELANERGELAAEVAVPWAVDAEGRQVPTRFTLRDGVITQVVDHRAGDFAYPIVADPKVKFCDFYTAGCVKFSKKETKKIHDAMFVSLGAGVGTLCGAIPAKNPVGLAVKAVCAAAVSAYFYTLRGVFKKAKKKGACVELKFRLVAAAVVTGKVVKC